MLATLIKLRQNGPVISIQKFEADETHLQTSLLASPRRLPERGSCSGPEKAQQIPAKLSLALGGHMQAIQLVHVHVSRGNVCKRTPTL